MKLFEIQDKILKSGLTVFTRFEFKRLLNVSEISAQKLLERYAKRGILIRLKGGLYCLKIKEPSSYLIANKLYEPSYVSFETALSYYNMAPEIVYAYTSATTRTTRQFNSSGQNFIYHKIKKEAFTGYKLAVIGGEKVRFAEPEKALADYLYYVFLKKKSLNDRLNVKGIINKKLFLYVSLFDKKGFLEWVKNVNRTT